jgi:hypothetical protein
MHALEFGAVSHLGEFLVGGHLWQIPRMLMYQQLQDSSPMATSTEIPGSKYMRNARMSNSISMIERC